MGIFGEAIYGHIGQYVARVYNACYMQAEDGGARLVNAGGLTEQDTVNSIFGNISIGPQHDSSIVLSLNAAVKGYSWAVRMAPQRGSAVSGGYCHAVHCESSLSSLYRIDSFLYFPFIPDGDFCASLIRDPASFTAQRRWQRNMQSVRPLQEQYESQLGRPLRIPRELMKRLTSYIVSQASVNARQYLYIRVPDGAPYEAYCLAALHDILTCIPAGLRAGILAATNCSPLDEQNYGIIFQKESFPATHPTDLSLHVNAVYPFLNNTYVSTPLRGLLEQIVDYPELTDKCYRTLEQEVFGDNLPDSYQSYENYYGISTIQKEQNRPSYLEECSNLLGTTKEPALRAILEKVVLDEYKSAQDLEAAIQRDPLFTSVRTFTDLSGYLQSRNTILAFLASHGISYSKLFIYRHLHSIALDAGAKNIVDLYDKIITEQRELEGFSESERSEILEDCRREAWEYFANIRNDAVDEEAKQAACALYARIAALDVKVNPAYQPPVSERNWYNGYQRGLLLDQFRKSGSPALADQILSIPDYAPNAENITCLTRESQELIGTVIGHMEEMAAGSTDRRPEPETARKEIGELVGLDDVIGRFFDKWKREIPAQSTITEDYRRAFERAMYAKALEYTRRSDLTGDHLTEVIGYAATRMPASGIDCIHEIERFAAEGIQNRRLNWRSAMGLYRAASAVAMEPELRNAFHDLVASEIRLNTLEEEDIRELYQAVQNPDRSLQRQYMDWSDHVSRTKEYLEKMKESQTLIKYLNVRLQTNTALSAQDISAARADMWNHLDIQERTISAFAASVAYLFKCSSEMVYHERQISRQTRVLKTECQILANDFGLGIYLDPNLTLSELYEHVRLYELWTEKEDVVLYSRRELVPSGQTVLTDSEGKAVFSYAVRVAQLQETIKRLLWVLDGEDYSVPGGAEVDLPQTMNDLLNDRYYARILQILDAAGILDNSPNLRSALGARGYLAKSGSQRKSSDRTSGANKYYLTAGALLLTFVLGAILSHFVWPKSAPVPVQTEPGVSTDAEGSTEKPAEETTAESQETGSSEQEAGEEKTAEKPEEGSSKQETEEEKPAEEQGTGNSKKETEEEKTTEKTGEEGGAADTTGTSENPASGDASGTDTGKSITVPEFVYNATRDAKPDYPLQYAWEFRDKVIEENFIQVNDNQTFLPGKAVQVYLGNSNYLVVRYCRWSCKEFSGGKVRLVIEDPGQETWLGFVEMNVNDSEIAEYISSRIWQWSSNGEIPDEVKAAGCPEEVINKIDEFIQQGLDYDVIKAGIKGKLINWDQPVDKVIYDGKGHHIN